MKNIKEIFVKFQEKLSALSTQHKVLLFAATLAIMGGGFYYFKFQSQMYTVNLLNARIADQKKKLAAAKAAAVKVEVLEKDLVQVQEEFTKLLALLPDQREIPGLLENVSKLGAKVGLDNVLFQPHAEIAHEFYAVIPIRLDLLGSFNDLGVFLDSIAKLDRILKVQSLTLTRTKGKQGSSLQVACNLETYRFVEQPAKPPPKANK